MNVSARSSTGTNRRATVVSPRQVAVGTFVGGPVAMIYYLRKNYLAIGDLNSSKKILWIGSLFLLAWNALITLDVLLPKPTSIVLDLILKVTPFILVIVARQIAQAQFDLLPRQYDFYSNWSVVGSAILCLVASIGSLLPAMIVVMIVVGASTYLGMH
jgi:hypothetical protein